MNVEGMKTNERSSRSPKKLVLFFVGGLCFICIILWLLLNWFIDSPKFERLSIESPTSYKANGGWISQEQTMTSRDSERFFVWRVEDDIFFDDITREDLYEYFTSWFSENGWKTVDLEKNDVCSLMPESEFLGNEGEFRYLGYRKDQVDTFGYATTACVAIWKDKKFDWYNIVVSTITPSRRTFFLRCFEVECE